MRRLLQASSLFLIALPFLACAPASDETACALDDADCDGVPDSLGSAVLGPNGGWAQHDFDQDGKGDGYAVDVDGDGYSDGIILDTDGDQLGDAVDTDGDHVADITAGGNGGSGGSGNGSGGSSTASGGTSGGSVSGECVLGQGTHVGAATTTGQYSEGNTTRNGQNYMFIANGWGQNWRSHSIAYKGTTMTVQSFDGSKQSNGAPAGYPSMFCGKYSDKLSRDCGLPRALNTINQINTGLAWSHPTGDGTYNVAYDVWMGNNGNLSSYFMVWFKDPPGESPAGSKTVDRASVAGVDGVWDIIAGTVNNLPIVNYVRPNGQEAMSLAFDMMNFINDGKTRNLNFPGAEVLSVAVGFEIWEGPVTNLAIDDFCVDVQ